MVNNNQKFRKTKVALAVVLTIGLTACGVDGDAGNVSNSTSTSNTQTDATQNTVGNQQLSGSVTGVVLDTNNVPVVGASVFLAGVEVTTDAGGVYYFDNVAVTNVNGSDGAVDTALGTALVISIVSEDHLGATVTVTPEAQVNNSSDDVGSSMAGSVHTYIDGFLAQAGTAVIPTISTRTFGYLRDCATGLPLAGGKVVFDFEGLAGAIDNNGSAVILASGVGSSSFSVMTDEDGMFDVLLPDDSVLTFLVNGYEAATNDEAVGKGFHTKAEGVDIFLGTSGVCEAVFTGVVHDAVAPEVVAIDGQMGTTVKTGNTNSTIDHDNDALTADEVYDYALLNDGFVNNFVIHFSEVMSEGFDLTQARVKVDGAVINDAVVARTDDGASATVTFAEDLVGGSTVDVWFPYWNAKDADDGLHVVDNALIAFDTPSIALDYVNAAYTHVFFTTFAMPTGDGAVTFDAQVINADDALKLTAYSSAFSDNIDGNSTTGETISQLNGNADTTARLIELGNEILTTGSITGELDSDFAVVPYDVSASPGGFVFSGDVATASQANGLAQFNGASHGDEVTLTPKNGWGDVLSNLAVTATLNDEIAPTAVLQKSYDITTDSAPQDGKGLTTTLNTFNANFGDGGEISGSASGALAEVGNPVLYVQPRMLAGRTERGKEFDALAADMAGRLSANDVDNGAVTGTLISITETGVSHAIYDATAFDAWAAVSAEIGVAFSENLEAAEGTPSFSGTAANITGYTINNDVAVNVAGDATSADLVDFVTADVMSLANDDAGSMLEFLDAYQDTAGNVITAASNAKVMIQDAMPPMVVSAKWLGATFVVEFNESIDTTSPVTLVVSDPTGVETSVNLTLNSTTPKSGNIYTITASGLTDVFIEGTDANNGEFFYDETGDTEEEKHAVLNWDNVSDATGNKWSDFTPVAAFANDWEVRSPRFLAYSDVADFTITGTFSGLKLADVQQDVGFLAIISFSHVIKTEDNQDIDLADKSAAIGAGDDGVFFEDLVDVRAFLQIDLGNGNGFAPMPTGTTASLTLTATSSYIELEMTTAGALSLGANFVVGTSSIVAIDDSTITGDANGFGGVTSTITDEAKVIDILIQ